MPEYGGGTMGDKQTDIRKALAVASRVYEALRNAASPGATEQTLNAAVLQAADGHEVRYDLLTGPRTAGIEGGATWRALRRGDPVLLDLCLKAGDHWCDVCRTYFLGEADDEMRAAYAAALACLVMLAARLRDGAAAGAMDEEARVFLCERGMAGWMRHHTGHGIGQSPFQSPVLRQGSQDKLAAGDVVTVEIGVYCGDTFGIRLENDYLVTATGAQNLWCEPQTLPEIMLPWPKRGAEAHPGDSDE